MIITNLAQAKRDKERVNVFVDGEFYLGLDKNTVIRSGIFKGKEVTEAELEELSSKDAVEYITRKLVAWCYKKPRSEREIRDKVLEMLSKRDESKVKDDPVQIADEVVQKMRAKGNTDKYFADWFAAERARQRRYGRNKIVSDLVGKGVPIKIAKASAAEAMPEEKEISEEVLDKKYGIRSVKEIEDYSERAKAINFLRSRGFVEF